MSQMTQTELTTLDEVRAEVVQAQALMEGLTEYVAAIRSWGETLPDRWGSTEWGTGDLDTSITGVSEAAAALGDAEPISEALGVVQDAITKAEALSEVLNEHQAYGETGAFRAA